MSRFLCRIALFLLVPAIYVGLIEISYLNRPDVYQVKKQELERQAPDLETLILGNSQVMNGIIPELFSSKTYNAGVQTQSLYYSHSILNRYSDQMRNLRRVVVNISYPTLFADHRTMNEYAFYYGRHMGLYRSGRPEIRFATFSIRPRQALTNAYHYYFKVDWNQITPVGSGGFYVYNDPAGPDMDVLSERESNRHHEMINLNTFEENRSDLQDLVETTRELGVQLIIIRAPEHMSYVNRLDQVIQQQLRMTIQDVVSQCNHCEYLDYSTDERFMMTDFYNSIHLNESGAAKLSHILDAELNRMGAETSPDFSGKF